MSQRNTNLITVHTDTSNWEEEEGKDSPPHSLSIIIALSCIVVVLIGCTSIGNTLVCVAVSMVRKLRKQPANYLLVSLAFADLCVGFMVMPLAFLYLIFGRWPFGQVLCDVWTTADVTLCTASIVNLCVISVDRYLVIVQPLKYCPRRTTRLMIVYIVIVWTSAFVVSLLPITFWHLGISTFWSPSPTEMCQVSQNAAYQIYATMFAFYIPATIIIVVNYKIFKAARRLTLADRRASAFSTPMVSVDHGKNNGQFSITRTLKWSRFVPCLRSDKSGTKNRCFRREAEPEEREPISGQDSLTRTGSSITSTRVTTPTNGTRRMRRFTVSSWRSHLEPLRLSLSKRLTEAISIRGMQRSYMGRNRFHIGGEMVTMRRHSEWPRGQVKKTVKEEKPRRMDTGHWQRACYRRYNMDSSNRETKAMKTLGLITGCFIACWLPFFIVALLKPLCPNHLCTIPGWFESLVLWLGYANSTLNPLLYAKYNKDFRIPFREILCCRFSTLKSVMRMEEYLDTFGSSFAPNTPTTPVTKTTNRRVPDEKDLPPFQPVDEENINGGRSWSSPAVLNRHRNTKGLDTIL